MILLTVAFHLRFISGSVEKSMTENGLFQKQSFIHVLQVTMAFSHRLKTSPFFFLPKAY